MNQVCNHICKTLKLQSHPHQPGCAPAELPAPQYQIGSIAEEAEQTDDVGCLEMRGVMPIPGSTLSSFLDAVRKDAKEACHATSMPEDSLCLGGAVLQWKDGPEIVEVEKGSPAEKAGCEAGLMLKLVGGQFVGQMPKQEVLQLLASENNMIVGKGFKVLTSTFKFACVYS